MRRPDALHAAIRASAVVALAFALAGCSAYSTVSKLWNVSAQTEQVTLEAAPRVNKGFPVAVDLVAVSDPDVVGVVADVEAGTWFDRRQEFVNDRGDVLTVRSFELVPGQRRSEIGYGYLDRRTYHGIFVFARYLHAGNHRARLDAYSEPTVILGSEGIRVETGS
jgi:type VI secretion system protein